MWENGLGPIVQSWVSGTYGSKFAAVAVVLRDQNRSIDPDKIGEELFPSL